MRNSFFILNFKKKTILVLGFLFIFYINSYGQNQKIADSLESIYSSGNYAKQERLLILRGLAWNHIDPEKVLAYSEELISLAQELDSINYLWDGYMLKGNALQQKGDLFKSQENYFQAGKIAREEKSDLKLGKSYITIADVYSEMGDGKNSIKYYNEAIHILRKENDSIGIASALYNTGDQYVNMEKYDSALIYFNESSLIFKKKNYSIGAAYNLGSIGVIYKEKGNYDLAKENLNQSIKILENFEDSYAISDYLITLSEIYADQNDFITAQSYAHRSLELAEIYGLKKQISESNLRLSKLYEKQGDMASSLKYFKNYKSYGDSVKDLESVEQIANIRTDYEIQKKEDEILVFQKEALITEMKAKRQKFLNIAFSTAAILILLLAISYYRRYRFSKKTNLIIEKEKDRSESLLLNILPKETALELKQSGKVKAQKFESVTVLFTDFIGFTRYAEILSPERLVESVDYYFSKFDEIIKKHKLEKIKTIGDSYMCAGGLHHQKKDHAIKIIDAACEIIKCMNEEKKLNTKNKIHFDIRIGINTGPIVAGVVGTNKFAYDIWGDTVNIASRMESASESNRVNVSEETYKLVKDKFDCEFRGMIEVKNKRKMNMYFVNGLKT